MSGPKFTIPHKTPKPPRGEDGHTSFTIRIKDDIVAGLEDIAAKSGHSRNAIIGMLLELALDNCEVEPKAK